ncbi:PREDICTED: esterase FE4-like [Dufourea novaeangliae]|uniref:esterase FE4-like n=1 Tax=Dufourea novaeangliae TaxID=178035 RepID=UPI000767120C|nr:PREDICTED: esterase FE4-like [Dufourea novaeangliae]
MRLNKWLFYAFVLVCVHADQDVQLEIPQGILKGLKTETILHNKAYYSFKGIPYAKPNVGRDKFRVPEPADPWEGVYDATHHRSTCPFYCMIKKGLSGEEDCLYLNVYTPVLDKEASKAVMVWFHPGGWNSGTADDLLFGPDFLVENDVILVTVNYRLGALGFLNTEDKNAPGNAGMKDQVLALKWVKDNIHFFGGGPNRVTIFGQCSGGATVQYHMLSPMSEGLFNGVIQQSGGITSQFSVQNNPREKAFQLGKALGIDTTDSAELIQKLSEVPVKDLIEATDVVSTTLNPLNGNVFTFVPSVEVDFGQDIFLPNDPWTLLKTGKIADVPLMTGLTSDECAFIAHGMLFGIEMLNTEPEIFLPYNMNITDPEIQKMHGQSLKKYYFGDKHVTKEDINEYTVMLGDSFFNAHQIIPLDLIQKRNSAPIYLYLFTYNAPFGFMKTLAGVSDGVAHGDDLGYLFYSGFFKNVPEPGSPAEKMTNILTKLWTNFAKDTNPTSNLDDDITVNWDPRREENNYMVIDQELKMEKNLLQDRMEFWKQKYSNVIGNAL